MGRASYRDLDRAAEGHASRPVSMQGPFITTAEHQRIVTDLTRKYELRLLETRKRLGDPTLGPAQSDASDEQQEGVPQFAADVEPVVQPDYTKARDEREGDVGLTPANYKITRELLSTKGKSDAILLHSLPRMDEIPTDVDITRWSRYWQEAFNGVVMRMALLALVLGATE